MKKNVIIILAIFIVPLVLYWGLTRDKLTTPPSIAANTPEIIKFASPMCYECQQLEKCFEEVFPKYAENINLRKIDVTKKDSVTRSLINEHNVKLVPTTVFKDKNGTIKRRIEGSVPNETLEMYIKEILIDG